MRRAVVRADFRWTWLWAAPLLAGLLSCGGPGPRLVVLIVVDTLRADHLGCYGDTLIQTPNIDRLAGDGVLYEEAFSAVPVTLPSVSTILTGAYPAQHGVRDNGPYQLDDGWSTAAERFQAAGYETAAFVSAAVLARDHNLGQGFEVYDDDLSMTYEPHDPLMAPLQDQLQGVERRAEVTVDRALEWLGNHRDRDAFVLVHLFDPHVPRDPPPPFAESCPGRPYDGEIEYVDQQIGRLLEGARRDRGELLILLTADHGEGLGDHQEQFHGDLLFDETLRVPLILQGASIPAGRRMKELVRTIDILPTLCALSGMEAPQRSPGAPLPGLGYGGDPGSAREMPTGTNTEAARETEGDAEAAGDGRLAYIETFRPRLSSGWCELRGLRSGRWKLIDGPVVELYDVVADPKEQVDLAQQRPALLDSLLRTMDATALAAVHRGVLHGASLNLSGEEREKLRSLGYVTPSSASPATSDSMAVWVFPPAARGAELGLPDPRARVGAAFHRIVAESFYSAGKALLAEGNYAEAARRFEAAIQSNESFTDAYLGFAEAATQAGRLEAAVGFLNAARKKLPHDPAILSALVDALVRFGRPTAALALIDDAVTAGEADSLLLGRREELRHQAEMKQTEKRRLRETTDQG